MFGIWSYFDIHKYFFPNEQHEKKVIDSDILLDLVRKNDIKGLEEAQSTFKCDLHLDHNKCVLLSAVKRGFKVGVKLLLSHGANVNSYDQDLSTPLHFAALRSDLDIIRILLHSEANPNLRDINGNTALQVALKYNVTSDRNLSVIKLLSYKSTDLSLKNTHGDTALHLAAGNGNIDTIKLTFYGTGNNQNIDGDTALHLSVRDGHIEIVKTLLNYGVSTNIKNKQGNTVLHAAAQTTNSDILELLVSCCYDKVSERNNDGDTPLHIAVYNGQIQNVNVILNHGLGLNISTKNNKQNTALHSAAETQYVDILEIFLKRTTYAHYRNIDGDTALHLAVNNGHIENVKVLLNYGENINAVNTHDKTIVYYALENNHTDILLLLLEKYAENYFLSAKAQIEYSNDIDKELLYLRENVNVSTSSEHGFCRNNLFVTPYFSFHLALKNKTTKPIVTLLLFEHDKDVTKQYVVSQWPIEHFTTSTIRHVKSQFINFIKLLVYVKTGCRDINEQVVELVSQRNSGNLCNGYIDIIDLLFKLGINIASCVDTAGNTLLHAAVVAQNIQLIDHILPHMESVINLRNNEGKTLLHLACSQGCINIVQKLLRFSLDINIKEAMGNTALHFLDSSYATFTELKIIMDILIKLNLDINITNNFGNTVLHSAILSQQQDLVKVVLPYVKSILNRQNINGETALHLACGLRNLDIITELTKFPLEINIKNDMGETALNVIIRKYHFRDINDILALLIKSGAVIETADESGNTIITNADSADNVD